MGRGVTGRQLLGRWRPHAGGWSLQGGRALWGQLSLGGGASWGVGSTLAFLVGDWDLTDPVLQGRNCVLRMGCARHPLAAPALVTAWMTAPMASTRAFTTAAVGPARPESSVARWALTASHTRGSATATPTAPPPVTSWAVVCAVGPWRACGVGGRDASHLLVCDQAHPCEGSLGRTRGPTRSPWASFLPPCPGTRSPNC